MNLPSLATSPLYKNVLDRRQQSEKALIVKSFARQKFWQILQTALDTHAAPSGPKRYCSTHQDLLSTVCRPRICLSNEGLKQVKSD